MVECIPALGEPLGAGSCLQNSQVLFHCESWIVKAFLNRIVSS